MSLDIRFISRNQAVKMLLAAKPKPSLWDRIRKWMRLM